MRTGRTLTVPGGGGLPARGLPAGGGGGLPARGEGGLPAGGGGLPARGVHPSMHWGREFY